MSAKGHQRGYSRPTLLDLSFTYDKPPPLSRRCIVPGRVVNCCQGAMKLRRLEAFLNAPFLVGMRGGYG